MRQCAPNAATSENHRQPFIFFNGTKIAGLQAILNRSEPAINRHRLTTRRFGTPSFSARKDTLLMNIADTFSKQSVVTPLSLEPAPEISTTPLPPTAGPLPDE